MSSPVPSPVRFIISSSAAVSARAYPLARAKITEVSSLWVCSNGPTSMSSTIACSAQPCGTFPSFSCCDHSSGTERAKATIRFNTAILRSIAWRGSPRQGLDEFVALLGEQLDAVSGEQLVVADRGRDRARARPRSAQPRLHVVIAVAAGLERIHPHRLLAGQPGRRSHPGIGALEVDFAGGSLRRELEMLAGGFQEVGDERNSFA